ncbi:BCL-6 corepressor-like [Phasianus colchicus]|uniref:BCL-6 corepressor-like n=1 Tax=Phasianus colchicus TaxID=9054 RepID=UPI00129E03DE|nr:BCL-6 corepressor-like [Phasianus colchicus]
MKDTAHDAGGTAPTSSTLHDDINELCVRIMRLCLNTKQEQWVMPRAVMPFSELPAATKVSELCRFGQIGWAILAGSSEEKQRTAAWEDATAKPNANSRRNILGHVLESPEGKESSKEKCYLKRHSVNKKADWPTGHIRQRPRPPLDKKRKYCSERLQNSGNQTENFTGKRQDEFVPAAKKMRRDLPVLPAPLHTKGLSSTNTNGNGKMQAQPSSAPAPTLAAQQHKTQESCKTDSPNTGKQKFQPEPVLQKQAEGQKPSGKRKCKTKHLDVQGRKRSFFAMDDPFDIEDSQDMVALPKKMMKQAEPTLHCGSLPIRS